jgi:hypothetical protein
MPNDCLNILFLSHSDKSRLEEAVAAYNKCELLKYFVPPPEDDPTSDWLNWRISNWGTKWDIYDIRPVQLGFDSSEVKLSFCTAWSPPIEAYYAAVEKHGFKVEGYYHEVLLMFCGVSIPNKRELTLHYQKGDEVPQDIDDVLSAGLLPPRRRARKTDENHASLKFIELLEYLYGDGEFVSENSSHGIRFWTRDIAPPHEMKDFKKFFNAWLKKEPIGCIAADGYRVIDIDGKDYYAHDLIYLYMTGKWPTGEIEHINDNKDDNRWGNLTIRHPGILRPCHTTLLAKARKASQGGDQKKAQDGND